MTRDDLLQLIPTFYNKQGNFMASRVPAAAMDIINELTSQCKGNLFERIIWIETERTKYNTCSNCGRSITKMLPYRNKRYGDFCSRKCSAVSDATKQSRTQTVLQRYGAANVSSVEAINERRKKTFVDRFGGDNPSCSAGVLRKRNLTYNERFGGSSPMASDAPRPRHVVQHGPKYP
jgi:hypothetical protein